MWTWLKGFASKAKIQYKDWVDSQPFRIRSHRNKKVLRIFKLGSLEHRIFPSPAAIQRLKEMLDQIEADGGNGDLIWGPDLEVMELTLEDNTQAVVEPACEASMDLDTISAFLSNENTQKSNKIVVSLEADGGFNKYTFLRGPEGDLGLYSMEYVGPNANPPKEYSVTMPQRHLPVPECGEPGFCCSNPENPCK